MRHSLPLILITKRFVYIEVNTYGSRVSVKNGLFEIEITGKKHYYPAGKIRSIVISNSTRISSDAILLALEKNVQVVFTDKAGRPLGRVWSHKYGSIALIRKNQVSFSRAQDGLQWVLVLIKARLERQKAIINWLDKKSKQELSGIDKTLSAFSKLRESMNKLKGDNSKAIFSSLRGIEGTASRYYFEIISSALPKDYQFNKRSQHPALDPFNSLLNYYLGILYSIVEEGLVRAGLDPYIGIFHRDEYNKPVLAFDMIELYRDYAEQVAINCFLEKVVKKSMFDKGNKGDFTLNGKGKKVLIPIILDYLDEVILLNEKRRSRRSHIFLEAQEFANFLLKYKTD